mmetsp:Transcript_7363/g.14840  ORF Transcript_7363/g.14840 Transcript_7363/m.14840 type:complete len:123 (+) Transcript_7363:177-545(+)
MFATERDYRERLLVGFLREKRVEAIRGYEERKRAFIIKAEVESQGIKEFDMNDVKAMMCGNLRLSARKVSVRRSQLGGRKISKSVVSVFKDANHVKFNTWATNGVKQMGEEKTRVGIRKNNM